MRGDLDEGGRGISSVRGGPVGHCPQCASDRLLAVTNGFETNFWCELCGSCWNVSFARTSRVDPFTCPGCAEHRRCRGRLLGDDPFGAIDVRERANSVGSSPRPGRPAHTYDRGAWDADL